MFDSLQRLKLLLGMGDAVMNIDLIRWESMAVVAAAGEHSDTSPRLSMGEFVVNRLTDASRINSWQRQDWCKELWAPLVTALTEGMCLVTVTSHWPTSH